MSYSELAKWVEQKEKEGYRLEEVKKYLIKQGYAEKEVEKLIQEVKKSRVSLKDFAKELGTSTIFLFGVSFIFNIYAIPPFTYFESVNSLSYYLFSFLPFYVAGWIRIPLSRITILLIALVLPYLLSDYLKKKNAPKVALIVEILTILGMPFLAIKLQLHYLMILIILALINPLILNYRAGSNHSLYASFLTVLISLSFASTITVVFAFIYVYTAIPLMGTITFPLAPLATLPIIAVFFYSYLETLKKLIKKTINKSETKENRKFRVFPLRIFNVFLPSLTNKKDSVRSAMLLTTAVLLFTMYVSLNYYLNGYNDLVHSGKQSLEVVQNLMKLKFYNSRADMTLRTNGFAFKDEPINWYDDYENLPYFECRNNSKCERIELSEAKKEKMKNHLEPNQWVVLGENETLTGVFILNYPKNEEVVSANFFEYYPEDIKNLKIIQELNSEWRELFTQKDAHRRRVKIFSNLSLKEKIMRAYTGKTDQDTLNLHFSSRKLLAKISLYFNDIPLILNQEIGWIEANKKERKPFYDGTQNLEEHLERLKRNVRTLELLETKFKPPQIKVLEQRSMLELTVNKFGSKTGLHKRGHDLRKKINELVKEDLDKQKERLSVSESLVSKIMRYKVLESQLALIIFEKYAGLYPFPSPPIESTKETIKAWEFCHPEQREKNVTIWQYPKECFPLRS